MKDEASDEFLLKNLTILISGYLWVGLPPCVWHTQLVGGRATVFFERAGHRTGPAERAISAGWAARGCANLDLGA